MSSGRVSRGALGALVRGPRLFLRHPRPGDAVEFLALRRQSRELHLPWEPLPEDGSDPISPLAFQRFLDGADSPHTQKHLMCRNHDDAIVGYVGLNQIFLGPFCSCYMGYWIGAPYARQGYATEGVRLALERAFTRLGLHRVEANIIPTNAPSLGVARKCGFRKEGYSPRYLRIAGQWQDHERWAMTVEDWQALAGPHPGT
jgi:[ribosomal protein S5]-alanine N-acetyltransferase